MYICALGIFFRIILHNYYIYTSTQREAEATSPTCRILYYPLIYDIKSAQIFSSIFKLLLNLRKLFSFVIKVLFVL